MIPRKKKNLLDIVQIGGTNWTNFMSATAQIDFETFLKCKRMPKLRAGGRVIWTMPKRKDFFLGSFPLNC